MTREELAALLERARALQQPTNRAARDTSRDWCRIIARADSDEADLYIYDEIGFWGTTAAGFVDQIRDISASTINLHINSPGGSVFDGLAIYNAIADHPATVNVIVDALAASAASFIAQAGDTIRMGRQAMMMIHDASGFTIGNASDHREMADLLDKLSNAIAEIYADRTGFPTAHWRNAMLAETWYSAQEAVDAMLADETTGGDEDDEEQARLEEGALRARANFDLTVFQYPGRDEAPDPVIPQNADPAPPAPSPTGVPTPDDGGDPDATRIRPAAETDPVSTETRNDPQSVDPPVEDEPEPLDLGAVFRQAAEAAVAPPPFELSADSVRDSMRWANDHAPAVHIPQRSPVPDPADVAATGNPGDESDSIARDDGEIGFGDLFRAAARHRVNNAPAVNLPASPSDEPSGPAPLDMQRIILEEATR